MNSNFKISVIVPVYNSENYIERCLDSILNQKYKNIELIIVNDGSMDNTEDIISKYNDDRIIYLSKKNTGVSDSRNMGIEKATGDYITFVDADDYVDENIYSNIFNIPKIEYYDMIMFGYTECVGKQKSKIFFPWKEKIKNFDKNNVNEELIPKMISNIKGENNYIMGSVWRILFKKNIAKKNKFKLNLTIGEDLIYCLDCINCSNSIIAYNECLYNYIKNTTSATEKYKENFEEINNNFHEIFLKKLQSIDINNEIEIRYGKNRMIMYTVSMSNVLKNKNASYSFKYNEIKRIAKKCDSDKYITSNAVKIFDNGRKIIYYLIKFRCYHLIIVLFQLKIFLKRRILKGG